MTRIVYIGNLQGIKNTSQNPLSLSNCMGAESTVATIAESTAMNFSALRYQTQQEPNPTALNMECKLRADIADSIRTAHEEPLIIVTEGFGTGVAMGALTRLQHSTSPLALITYRPVPDVLQAFTLQLGKKTSDALTLGLIDWADMPIDLSSAAAGSFRITKEHMTDDRATQFITHTDSRIAFQNSAARHIKSAHIVYNMGDQMTPAVLMTAFENALRSTLPQGASLHINNVYAQSESDMIDPLKASIIDAALELQR